MQTNIYQDTLALLHTSTNHSPHPNRRLALQTALGIGYCAAAMPLVAQTAIKTPTDGLVTGEVTIDVQGFKMPVFRAAPKDKTNLPVVLVISEIFGVHEYIADVACRFAREGYLAIAPELFIRQGDPSSYGEIAKLQAEVISKVPDAQVMKDLDACIAWSGAHGGDTKRIAITGFCWGGRITWLYAMHQPQLKAAVAWYGRLEGEKTAATPAHPIDLANQLRRIQPTIAIVLLTAFLDPAQLDKRVAELPKGSRYLIKHSVTKIDVLVNEIKEALKSAPTS